MDISYTPLSDSMPTLSGYPRKSFLLYPLFKYDFYQAFIFLPPMTDQFKHFSSKIPRGVFVLVVILFSHTAVPAVAAEIDAAKEYTIVFNADLTGHFRGTLWINNVSAPFVIDTGATVTTIPMKYAAQAHLTYGDQIEIQTAGGRVFGKTTVIKNLKIGEFEINNIVAHLNQHLSEVLVGMNTLKYFRLNQTADKLILTVNRDILAKEKPNTGVSIRSVSATPVADDPQPSSPIFKSIVCDESKHCITKYGN